METNLLKPHHICFWFLPSVQCIILPLSCIFCDHIKFKRNKPSFTYVTAYCANDRYSTRTSRPLFSSFKNSLTHLLKKKIYYWRDSSHALPQKASENFCFSTTNVHCLKGKYGVRRPRLSREIGAFR